MVSRPVAAALVRVLAERGWPVPEPVGGPTDLDGRLWLAMRRLPGRPMPTTSATSFLRGQLLARLHRELTGVDMSQRPGWARKHELAKELPDLLEDLPHVLAERLPDRATDVSSRMVEFAHHTLARRIWTA